MILAEPDCAGKGQFTDVHYRQTNLTSRHVTTARNMSARNTMDQKELEDRLAAAEALSSLGSIAEAFRESNIVAQVSSVSSTATGKTVVAKAEAKGRSGRKDEKGTGRDTKSRSARGRGRGKVQNDGTPAMTPAGSVTPDSVQDKASPHPPVTETTSKIPVSRSRGRGRGRGGGKHGNKSGLPVVQDDASLSVQSVHDPEKDISRTLGGASKSFISGDSNISSTFGTTGRVAVLGSSSLQSSAGSVGNMHQTNAAFAPSSAAIPRLVIGISKGVASTSSLYLSSVPPYTSTITSSSSSPPSSSAAAATLFSLPSSTRSASESSQSASSSIPATTAGNLQSQPNLSSIHLDSLSSFSLGSTGLPNLPSIPNLPSLPSAIASFQLDSASGVGVAPRLQVPSSQDSGANSQLSPLSRDSGEKSLPLKKRKIVDSSSSASPTLSLPKASPVSPQVVSPSTASLGEETGAPTMTAASTSVTVAEKPVSSPAPDVPMNVLSQVLPPQMYTQLLTEIETAITPDEDGDVPLHIAVVHENEAMVKKLIQLMALAGQKVDRYNKQHQTPLHLAVKLKFQAAIQMLLEAGADPNLVDSVGLTSTHMAVQAHDIQCLEALLQWSKYPCDLNYRNFEGLAPLHSAVMNNDLDIVSHLLENGAEVNIMDGKSGRTVLFHAAETNQKEAVELLLNKGADPDLANYAGVMPAMAAQGRSHTTVARLLARAQDDVGDDEKGGEKEEKGAKKLLDSSNQGPVALEIRISEGKSDSSHPAVQELGQKLSTTMQVQMKQCIASTKGGSQRQTTPSVSAAPPILQSSSVTGSAVRAQLQKTVDPQKKAAETAALPNRQQPGSILRATHQLPGVITKMTSGLQGALGGAPRATAMSRRNSVPASVDSSDVKSKSGMLPSGDPSTVPLGLIKSVTEAQQSSDSAWMLTAGSGKSRSGMKREAPAEDSDKDGQAAVRFAASVPGQAAMNPDTLRLMMQNLMKALVEKQNGGQAGVVNVPVLPGVFPLAMTTTASTVANENPTLPSMEGPRYTPVRAVNRMTPLPIPTSSMVTSPAISQIGSSSVSSTVTPSAAHSQPTRPLLVFRSSSVDPGSGDGRRMESVEVRHVTTDALLALQQSATNSVNPANQNIKSAPAGFEQQVRNFLSGRLEGLSGGVPMEMERGPPVSNHVTRENLPNHSYGFGHDGYSDEPKDLSLKPKKTQDSASPAETGIPHPIKKELLLSPVYSPERVVSLSDSGEKKRKASGSIQDLSKPSKKMTRAKSSKAHSKASKKAVVDEKSFPHETNVQEIRAEDRNVMQGEVRTISISESGLITSEPNSNASSPIVEIIQGQQVSKQGERSLHSTPVKKTVDIFHHGKPVSLTEHFQDNQLSTPHRQVNAEKKASSVAEMKGSTFECQDSFLPYAKDQANVTDHSESGQGSGVKGRSSKIDSVSENRQYLSAAQMVTGSVRKSKVPVQEESLEMD